MDIGNFINKAAGLGAIYLSVKDSNLIAKAYMSKAPQQYIAKTYPDVFLNSQRVDMESLPTVVSSLKKSWFNYIMNDTTMPMIYAAKGYMSGLKNSIINNVVPLSLGIGAFTLKKPNAKICTALLGLYAAKVFIYDVLNIGKYKKI